MGKNSKNIVKKISPLDEIKVVCKNNDGENFLITFNMYLGKNNFILWKEREDCFEKMKESNNPLEFDSFIFG